MHPADHNQMETLAFSVLWNLATGKRTVAGIRPAALAVARGFGFLSTENVITAKGAETVERLRANWPMAR